MYRHIADFLTIWREESAKTLAFFDAIPDTAAGAAVAEGHRDLRRMAWHLCETLVEMPAHMGLQVSGFPGEPGRTPPPAGMKAIRDAYAALSASLMAEVARHNDMALAMAYPFYGETWTGALALYVLVNHQTHHRGQMSVLMRQAGLKVPGAYGPAKEDWAAMGMPEPAI
ncbi:MAG TPA: DinB family protein [Holophagaceae bacterium]|nr:DinB family protein [Holophagaceae bacterium]